MALSTFLDLVLVASQMGQSGETSADINGDGIVNIQRLGYDCQWTGEYCSCTFCTCVAAGQVEQWLSLAKQAVSRPIQIQTSLSQREFRMSMAFGHWNSFYECWFLKRPHCWQIFRIHSTQRHGFPTNWRLPATCKLPSMIGVGLWCVSLILNTNPRVCIRVVTVLHIGMALMR